ncbi:MAG TPA: response regulator [Polaromonas sp.]|uniref:response regulator n=1 Tax=Polaromonas sp. TaxID=1869339 RepID=UPI002D4E53ED|nr:response regulator [Polaromonas sp.]HYW57432.1 response regulator [Polaromonas sp.]
MNSPAPIQTTAHILIAEDSGVQAFMLRRILEEQGYKVSRTDNGRSALQLAGELQPDLIVSDVNMPEMSGYELCKHIKANPALRDCPVILVTTLSDPQDVLLGLQCGADSFVIKPYNKDHMLARVALALSNRLAGPQPQEAGGVDIVFHGEKHHVTASRAQILNLLISTYDASAQRNKELHDSRELLATRTAEAVAANGFLDSVIENIPHTIFVKDAVNLHYVRLNRAGEELVGYSRHEMLGKSDYDFFPKEESDSFVANDREVLATGGQLEITEEEIQTADKGIRLLRTKKVAVLNDQAVPTHLLGISEDVTLQKQMEREILQLNDALMARASDLEASNKSLDSFTAAATHDLRSPLALIGGFAGLLEKHYGNQLDDKGRRYLSVITATTRNMSKLIDDLLAFSKLGQGQLSKTTVDVQQLVPQIVKDLQLDAAGAQTLIELGHLPAVPADAALLRQVWVNLLSNAVKYSSRAASPRVDVSGRVVGTEAIYSVRDNGAGFDMEQYDKLFEMFQRLHTPEEFEGTGVGLPIVHRIVTRHGGRIWAEGKVGHGAVFHFSLPV